MPASSVCALGRNRRSYFLRFGCSLFLGVHVAKLDNCTSCAHGLRRARIAYEILHAAVPRRVLRHLGCEESIIQQTIATSLKLQVFLMRAETDVHSWNRSHGLLLCKQLCRHTLRVQWILLKRCRCVNGNGLRQWNAFACRHSEKLLLVLPVLVGKQHECRRAHAGNMHIHEKLRLLRSENTGLLLLLGS